MATLSDERLSIMERFGDSDVQDLCAQVRRLQLEVADLRNELRAADDKRDQEVTEDVIRECGVEFMVGRGALPGAEPVVCRRPADHRPMKDHADHMTEGDRRRYRLVDGGFRRWR